MLPETDTSRRDRGDGFLDLIGTIRARPPSATLEAIRPHLPAMGITRIARVTGLDCVDVPVSTCIRPDARSLTVSQGKGFTPELADVSAAMEAVELYHAEHPPAPAMRGTYDALARTNDVVSPAGFGPGRFPRQADTDLELDWIEVEDLLARRRRLMPHALVDFDKTRAGEGIGHFLVSTNGLASGNTREEATCHALYEVVERDAVARLHRLPDGSQREAEVDTRTIEGPARRLIQLLTNARINTRIWDATGPVGLPTFACYIRGERELRGLGLFSGMGTHHKKDIALCRALTEAIQTRLTIISGARDDVFPCFYAHQQESAGFQLPPTPPGAGKPFSACSEPPLAGSFAANLDDVVTRLAGAGFSRVLRFDHTRPEFEIPVVHVFVPGTANVLE
jgi:ribosomal protein S12 methylthiotransferase accessory factor